MFDNFLNLLQAGGQDVSHLIGGAAHAIGGLVHPQPAKTTAPGPNQAPPPASTKPAGISPWDVIKQLPTATLQAPAVIAKGANNMLVQPLYHSVTTYGQGISQGLPKIGEIAQNQRNADTQLKALDAADTSNQAQFKAGKITPVRFQKMAQDIQNQRAQVTGTLTKQASQYQTPKQFLNESGQLGMNLASLGLGAGGAEEAAAQGAHPLLTALAKGAASNAAYGAASGGLNAYGQGASGKEIAKQALIQGGENAALGAALAGIGYAGGKIVQGAKENPDILKNERGSVPLPGGGDQQKLPMENAVTPSLDKNGNPIKATNKFQQSVKQSPNSPDNIKSQIDVGTHTVRSTEALDQEAMALAEKNPKMAQSIALAGNSDKSVAMANVLMTKAAAQGDAATVNSIAQNTAASLIEHGRAVQAASLINRMSPEGVVLTTNQMLTKAGAQPLSNEAASALIDQAKTVAAMPEGRDKLIAQGKLQQQIGKQIPSNLTDKAISIWKAGLLTGPKTVSKIAISNPLMGTLETAKDVPASAADKLMSLITGQRTLTAPDLTQAGAYAGGAKSGLQDAGTYLTTGVKLPNSSGFGVGELQSHANFGDSAAGKALNAYTQAPGRVHGAISMPFYEGRLQASLAQQGEAAALNSGLKGAEKTSFIKDFINNPSKDALANASKDAQYATLQQKTALGSAASGFQQKLGPVGQVIAPFTRIPGAVATGLANYSPAGPVKEVIQQIHAGNFDQRSLAQAIGRGVTGTGIMAVGAALMNKGLMTGPYPTNRDQQAQWQLEGKQPNSILVGGKWQSIGSLGPAAQGLLAGGQYAAGAKTGGVLGGIAQGSSGAVRSITDQPYLTGVSGAINAINTPTQATSFLDQTAGSLVPTGLKQLAVATDPLQRTTAVASPVTSVKNAITNGIPGLREQNLPKQDVFGQDQAREGSTLSNLTNPLNPTTPKTSPVINELNRLLNTANPASGGNFTTLAQVAKKLPQPTPANPKAFASDQTRYDFIGQTGPAIQSDLERLMTSPQYQNADDAGKSKLISDVVSGQRGAGKISVLGEQPSKLTSNVKNALSGQLPTGSKVSATTDPAAAYKQAVVAYNQTKSTLTPAQDVRAQANLNRLSVEQNYPAAVVQLYGLSKAQLNNLAATNPSVAQQLDQVQKLGQDLANAGVTTKNKFATFSTKAKGTKLAKVNFGTSFSKLSHLLSSTQRGGKAPKGIKVPRVKIASNSFKPTKSGKIKVA